MLGPPFSFYFFLFFFWLPFWLFHNILSWAEQNPTVSPKIWLISGRGNSVQHTYPAGISYHLWLTSSIEFKCTVVERTLILVVGRSKVLVTPWTSVSLSLFHLLKWDSWTGSSPSSSHSDCVLVFPW